MVNIKKKVRILKEKFTKFLVLVLKLFFYKQTILVNKGPEWFVELYMMLHIQSTYISL